MMQSSSPAKPALLSEQSRLGRHGEELAAAFLQQEGYRLVASNFTIPVGRNRLGAVIQVEIDLVAYEGPTLCFIEVKTRASDWFALPSANVDLRKQRQITRAARAYRRLFGLSDQSYRYDVVSIVMPPADETNKGPQVNLLRNFWSEERFRKRQRDAVRWD